MPRLFFSNTPAAWREKGASLGLCLDAGASLVSRTARGRCRESCARTRCHIGRSKAFRARFSWRAVGSGTLPWATRRLPRRRRRRRWTTTTTGPCLWARRSQPPCLLRAPSRDVTFSRSLANRTLMNTRRSFCSDLSKVTTYMSLWQLSENLRFFLFTGVFCGDFLRLI